MSNMTQQPQQTDLLIETIANGFKQLNENSDQREALLKKQYELELETQQKRNLKWKMGAVLAAIAILVLGYIMHKTISVFEEDMNSMSVEMTKMSGYMKSMSGDISTMSGNIGTMAPNMASMAKNMNSMDHNMGSMGQDMGQMNRAMSPLMGNMQKFVPGNW